MKILISNDDGIEAAGIHALYRAAKKLGTVKVVAPEREQSTSGHSITLHKPLRLIPMEEKNFYGVSGKPADCVHIGAYEFGKPDLVLSGINRGANMGQDVFYSGTVSAAREAVIMGIPAIAVSLAVRNYKKVDFKAAEAVTAKTLKAILQHFPLNEWPQGVLLNLNIPQLPASKIKGVRLVRQGRQLYSGRVLRRKDNRGRAYYWIGGTYKGFANLPGTDCTAVAAGYASLTVHHLDTSDHTHFPGLDQLFPVP